MLLLGVFHSVYVVFVMQKDYTGTAERERGRERESKFYMTSQLIKQNFPTSASISSQKSF